LYHSFSNTHSQSPNLKLSFTLRQAASSPFHSKTAQFAIEKILCGNDGTAVHEVSHLMMVVWFLRIRMWIPEIKRCFVIKGRSGTNGIKSSITVVVEVLVDRVN